MWRMTYKENGKVCVKGRDLIEALRQALTRLSAYEDTGLEPWEIEELTHKEKNNDVFFVRLCPVCGGDTIVVNSREDKDGRFLRRRKCLRCGNRFSTIEVRRQVKE